MKAWMTSLGSCIGSGFAALCCLGTPAVISLLSAIGLGFLVHDGVLLPLLFFFVGLNLLALSRSLRQHGRKEPFSIALASAIFILSGLWLSPVMVGIGIAAAFIASGLEGYFSKTCRIGCQSNTSHFPTERR
jgi:mercuric ion transport protein